MAKMAAATTTPLRPAGVSRGDGRLYSAPGGRTRIERAGDDDGRGDEGAREERRRRRSSADDGDGGGAAISVAARRDGPKGDERVRESGGRTRARRRGGRGRANDAMDDGMDARAGPQRRFGVRNAASVAEGAE